MAESGYHVWYSRKAYTKNELEMIMGRTLKNGVLNLKREGDKIIAVEVVLGE